MHVSSLGGGWGSEVVWFGARYILLRRDNLYLNVPQQYIMLCFYWKHELPSSLCSQFLPECDIIFPIWAHCGIDSHSSLTRVLSREMKEVVVAAMGKGSGWGGVILLLPCPQHLFYKLGMVYTPTKIGYMMTSLLESSLQRKIVRTMWHWIVGRKHPEDSTRCMYGAHGVQPHIIPKDSQNAQYTIDANRTPRSKIRWAARQATREKYPF